MQTHAPCKFRAAHRDNFRALVDRARAKLAVPDRRRGYVGNTYHGEQTLQATLQVAGMILADPGASLDHMLNTEISIRDLFDMPLVRG